LLYISLAWLLFANDLLLVALLLVSFSILSYTIFMILPSRLVIEATIKYYALSAVSLILFILGLVLLFSITGSCDLLIIKNKFLLAQEDEFILENVVLKLAFLGIFSGLLFKLGAAPFHV
jgi:NADH:ubiquinone oxidoreductase subunit 2 (subunit N)